MTIVIVLAHHPAVICGRQKMFFLIYTDENDPRNPEPLCRIILRS